MSFHLSITKCGSAILLDKESVWTKYSYSVSKTNKKVYAKLEGEYLHRLIMRAKEGQIVDHINGCTLDNRKKNLRFVTTTQHCANASVKSNSKSGIKGITQHRSGRWQARMRIKGRRKSLGYFDTMEEAGLAYASAHKQHHGEYSHESN